MAWVNIFFEYVCPSLGCVMSAAMYAAPVNDLRTALLNGKLGSLNPTPWAVMSGNCLGWCAYAYFAKDPFILASNIPGLVLSFWLNMGAAKLQYYQEVRQRGSAPNHESYDQCDDKFIYCPQEVLFLRIMAIWFVIVVSVGWLGLFQSLSLEKKYIIGLMANLNVIFFFAAPLSTMKEVIAKKSSDTIHLPTMVMNWLNCSFWMLYGIAKLDPVIYIPNAIGLTLGIAQGILAWLYPRTTRNEHGGDNGELDVDRTPLLPQDANDQNVSSLQPETGEP